MSFCSRRSDVYTFMESMSSMGSWSKHYRSSLSTVYKNSEVAARLHFCSAGVLGHVTDETASASTPMGVAIRVHEKPAQVK